MTADVKHRSAVVFKYAVYSLLMFNVWLLFRAAAADEIIAFKALDQIGWLLILGVFEWETRGLAMGGGRRSLLGWPTGVELFGYGCAVFALANYLHDRIWLDVGNSVVWLAISAMIWLDILRPVGANTPAYGQRHIVKVLLYAATFAFAVLWGADGAALDFYDAVLWILCFFAIEMNLLRIEPRVSARRS